MAKTFGIFLDYIIISFICKSCVFAYFFSTFDLYSKNDMQPDMKCLIPYYQKLIDCYVPGKLDW